MLGSSKAIKVTGELLVIPERCLGNSKKVYQGVALQPSSGSGSSPKKPQLLPFKPEAAPWRVLKIEEDAKRSGGLQKHPPHLPLLTFPQSKPLWKGCSPHLEGTIGSRETGAGWEPIPPPPRPKGQQRRHEREATRTFSGGLSGGCQSFPSTSQPPAPPPVIGRGKGVHRLSSSLGAPEKWAHQGLVPHAASTLTSTASSTFAHIPTPPPSPRPARPFVLIPDSAAPAAAAAKRALHFRFRAAPPRS